MVSREEGHIRRKWAEWGLDSAGVNEVAGGGPLRMNDMFVTKVDRDAGDGVVEAQRRGRGHTEPSGPFGGWPRGGCSLVLASPRQAQ